MERRDFWPWHRPAAGLAVTEDSLLALGTGRERRVASRSLPPGLVAPQPASANVRSVSDLARLAKETLDEIGVAAGSRLALALPDRCLVIRVQAAERGRPRREHAETVREACPFPADEARIDFWHGARGEWLGVAIWKSVASEYEQLADALECRLGWVDGISLARIPGWARDLERSGGLDVQAQIYGSYYCLTVFRDGELVDARTKLRPPGALEPVGRELARIPAHFDDAPLRSLTLSGADAEALATILTAETRVDASSEAEHLAGTLAVLLERGAP